MTGYGIRTSPDENQLRIIPAGSLHRKVAASWFPDKAYSARSLVIREDDVARCYAGKGVVRYQWSGRLGRRCEMQHATSPVICLTRKRAQ
jgi:hypothetical protein